MSSGRIEHGSIFLVSLRGAGTVTAVNRLANCPPCLSISYGSPARLSSRSTSPPHGLQGRHLEPPVAGARVPLPSEISRRDILRQDNIHELVPSHDRSSRTEIDPDQANVDDAHKGRLS